MVNFYFLKTYLMQMLSKLKPGILARTLGTGIILLFTSAQTAQAKNLADFQCGQDNGLATIVTFRGKPVTLIKWNEQLGGVDAGKRCKSVSNNLQANREYLQYLVPGKSERGYSVLCASQGIQRESQCPNDRVIMTLTRNEDPDEIIQLIGDAAKGNMIHPNKQSSCLTATARATGNKYISIGAAISCLKPIPENTPPTGESE
jgi:hypothetical protein